MGFFDTLKKGLEKTRNSIVGNIESLFAGGSADFKRSGNGDDNADRGVSPEKGQGTALKEA